MKLLPIICIIIYLYQTQMNITHLPNDLINIIINISNGYKLMYVCKSFKNVIYQRLTKCNDCSKIVKIDNNELWLPNILCHEIDNFYNKHIIHIKQFDCIKKFMFTIKKLSNINDHGYMSIANDIKIYAKNDKQYEYIDIPDLQNKQLEHIQGNYKLYLKRFNNLNDIKYIKYGRIIITGHQNMHTNVYKQLRFIISIPNREFIIKMKKIENQND